MYELNSSKGFFLKNLRTFAAVMKQGNTNQQLAMQRNIFVLAFFLIIYLAIPNKLLPPPLHIPIAHLSSDRFGNNICVFPAQIGFIPLAISVLTRLLLTLLCVYYFRKE